MLVSSKRASARKALINDAMTRIIQFSFKLHDIELMTTTKCLNHIAGYGVARSFAKQLNYDDEADLLTATIEEEGAADKKLTSIAEGGLFALGINEKAQSE